MLDTNNLVRTQIELERQTWEEAKARRDNDLEQAHEGKEFGRTLVGQKYTNGLSKQLTTALSAFMASQDGKNGKSFIAYRMLKECGIETEVVAHLTIKAIVNKLAVRGQNEFNRVALCRSIGELVHDEWRVRVFAEDATRKAVLKKLVADFKRRNYPRHWRKKTIKNYFDAYELMWEGWSISDRIKLGHTLLCLVRDHLSMIEPTTAKQIKFRTTEEFNKHFDETVARSLYSYMIYKPMVVPPKPWAEDNLFRGGYYTRKVRYYPIIKKAMRRDVEHINDMDLSSVLPALNAIQETAWRVNKEMVEALDYAYNHITLIEPFNHKGIGKLVNANPVPLPEEPEGYRVDPDVTKKHNHKCFLLHDKNRQDKSRRIHAIMTISTAKQFAYYDEIYFPHNLDSRGRAYPLPGILNPQGPDYVKALLEFAEGKPIETQEQEDWLAICGANAYGNDKAHLHERAQWVRDNEAMILEIARDWRNDLRWTKASEPFAFLRFCFEWRDYREHGKNHCSHIVVPVDATCSGLQHYAAMFRDEIGGRAVNLVPGMDRQDVYGDVARVVIRSLEASDEPTAKRCLELGVDRKITKRQVMVVPYAGKFASCMAYTREAITERLQDGYVLPWDASDNEVHNEHVVFLSKEIWAAISEVVVKAKEGMRWLNHVASKYSAWANKQEVDDPYDRRMTWVTPDGFEVNHWEEDERESRIETKFDGRIRLTVWEGRGTLDVSRMSLSVAPNFVHSLDATHLRLTVRRACHLNITNAFGMVHDSFGVHAHDMPRFLTECIKPTFVEMYENHDVINEMYEKYARVVPDLELPPAKGTLDLRGILKSEFFFS